MATIEPRLIHLLNVNDSTPELSNIDLPPFHSLPFRDSVDGPLPSLERDGTRRSERVGAEGQPRSGLSYVAGEDDGLAEGNFAGTSDVLPMRTLLRDVDNSDFFYPLAPIHDDVPELASDDAANKKRNRALTTRDDYLQLPNPVKKQKPAALVPPIINGLHEPPPDAALFPPIASHSFSDDDTGHLPSIQEKAYEQASSQASERRSKKTTPPAEKPLAQGRKRASKPRRKWTEEETNHLLLGVNKHGVGQWTFILEDPEFKFDRRSAGDLKDRFRTCCPAELRGAKPDKHSTTPTKQKAQKGLHSENILHEDDDSSTTGGTMTPPTESEAPSKSKKPRAHRKKMEDLEHLGINGPFKKSSRRVRTPFTEQDDREILEGLEKYGPAWTKIQRDPCFHLQSRQPTDLRDRVRNKYHSHYQRIDKGTYQAKSTSKGNDTMEPSVNTSIDNTFKASTQINRTNSKEELHRAPLQFGDLMDPNPSPQGLDVGDTTASQWLGSEMGISRLLLHDAK